MQLTMPLASGESIAAISDRTTSESKSPRFLVL
jgi:hypothetical protein